MRPPKNTKEWLQRHVKDPYVKKAQQEGYRSRAVYKLSELNDKYRVFKPGMVVVDLGAAPGGWSQYAARCVGTSGQVYALDLLPIAPIAGVTILQGDFTEEAILTELQNAIGERQVDVVLSDMAPNLSGIKIADQSRSMLLVELALDFAINHLKHQGRFIAKVFQGAGFDELLQTLRSHFSKVIIRKPKASRPNSKEVYILAEKLTHTN